MLILEISLTYDLSTYSLITLHYITQRHVSQKHTITNVPLFICLVISLTCLCQCISTILCCQLPKSVAFTYIIKLYTGLKQVNVDCHGDSSQRFFNTTQAVTFNYHHCHGNLSSTSLFHNGHTIDFLNYCFTYNVGLNVYSMCSEVDLRSSAGYPESHHQVLRSPVAPLKVYYYCYYQYLYIMSTHMVTYN